MTWPDCSPPRKAAFPAQRLEDVAVADRRRDDSDSVLRHEPMEAEVRHHRHRDDVDAEGEREDGEDLVAVDDLAALVDREHAVAVAVEGDAEVESLAATGVASAPRSVAPQPTLMFEPSGSTPIACTSAPEPLERRRRERRERAVRAVDADAQAGQVGAEALDDVREVALADAVDAARPTRRRPLGVEERLDRLLLARRRACRRDREELDAVVLRRVVRRGDDGAELVGEERDGWGRKHAAEDGSRRRPRRCRARAPARARARSRACRVRRGRDRRRPTSVAAFPSRSTSSGVRSSPTTPRTPSVPK